ncbi:TonB-dependent receptor [Croceibacterium ferulae]|uniref:TonB-dependent receptor n=1 Tax=Croceibacterium ferulae TaxID=1854641 RepID=UPI000EAD1F37|nr:TonB-dependent receptor [Croceibacterium ferulae]
MAQATASWAVLGLALAAGSGQALAQAAPGTEAGSPVVTGSVTQDVDPAPDTVADAAGGGDEIIVSGARESQQSANNRKRNARTATDSIVADDIGSFPDRNVNEAISRIPGVALSRNEFGEGEAIAVRGNGPDLTRVELDGIGVQSTNSLTGSTSSGRGADLRELPAELVKSIDVVKGSTADMTEGSIGGTVQIKTRTGLDFDDLFITARAGVTQNSLGKDYTPDFNAVVANQFFDDRLGVILSGTYTKLQNNGHNYETTTSGNRGYSRFYDFDGSPEKTFEYNLDTLGTDQADVPFASSTFTPRTLLERMIAADTQAECFELIPFLAADATNAAKNQRTLEQRSCQAQWYDQAPSLIRNFTNTQEDERYSIDGRLDFEITPEWTVFAKGTIANRRVDDQFRSRTPVTLFGENVGGTFVTTPGVGGQPGTREVSPNAPPGYFLFNPDYGIRSFENNPVLGDVLNVRPESVVVDEAHNLTNFTLTNNSVNIDQISNIIDTKTSYVQAGTNYYGETWEIEAFVGMTKATTSRNDKRFSRSYQYGDATLALQPNGLWDIQLPADYDDTDPNNFVQLNPAPCIGAAVPPPNCLAQREVAAGEFNLATPAYTQAQLPLTTPNFGVSYTPALGEASEKIAKLDVSYLVNDEVPFFTRFKMGAMYRRNEVDRWNNGGYTAASAVGSFGQPGYIPAVTVPRAIVRGSLRACEPTATSVVDCNYGFVPNANPALNREGVTTLTADELRQLFIDTADGPDSAYFGDLPNRGSLPPSWTGIRVDELFGALEANNFMNFDCLKECVGSDGQVYAQPVTSIQETIKNVYAMFDFELDNLPLGLVFNGNMGIRGVMRDVKGTGFLTLESIQVTPSYNPLTPNAPGGITTRTFSQNTTINASTSDWLPTVNLNLWAFDETVVLRAYGGKTIALPNMNNLVASGTCTIDERDVLDGNSDFGCGGRVGNPGLSPFKAWSYNASLEWYPNRDTLLSATFGRLDVSVGNPIGVQRDARPFQGSDQIDPGTGLPLSDYTFTIPTFADGPGYSRDIWEFQAKTAFTFLPWIFRHTGADANLAILSSAVTTGQRDPLTGDIMGVPDESKYTTNVSLWYDDSKFQARVTYQNRTSTFACITPCGGNNIDFNYPGEQWTNVRLAGSGYSPGNPRFIDGTTFIDAKLAYNINPMFQVYVEGRNLRKEAQTESAGDYQQFADGTPKVYRLRYGGRRFMAGVRFRFGS